MSRATQKALSKLEKDGYVLGKKLGQGFYGSVFELKGVGNRVLKITTDKQEAQAMSLVRDNPHPNIVKVHKAWRYKSIKGVYFIEIDKLKKIDGDKTDEIIEQNFNMGTKKKRNDMHLELTSYINGTNSKESLVKAKEVIKQNMSKEALKLYDDLMKAAIHIKKIGIQGWDLHGGNVMKKGNRYVAIDLGDNPSAGKITDVRENICQK
tara:strand:- start:133 stop:756 length:624 start_codon:yes stop_codon:yes gene_type:complete